MSTSCCLWELRQERILWMVFHEAIRRLLRYQCRKLHSFHSIGPFELSTYAIISYNLLHPDRFDPKNTNQSIKFRPQDFYEDKQHTVIFMCITQFKDLSFPWQLILRSWPVGYINLWLDTPICDPKSLVDRCENWNWSNCFDDRDISRTCRIDLWRRVKVRGSLRCFDIYRCCCYWPWPRIEYSSNQNGGSCYQDGNEDVTITEIYKFSTSVCVRWIS